MPEWDSEQMFLRINWFLYGIICSCFLFMAQQAGRQLRWNW